MWLINSSRAILPCSDTCTINHAAVPAPRDVLLTIYLTSPIVSPSFSSLSESRQILNTTNLSAFIGPFNSMVLWSLEPLCVMYGSPGDVSEEPVTQEKRKKGWRMTCDVSEATEGLGNEL